MALLPRSAKTRRRDCGFAKAKTGVCATLSAQLPSFTAHLDNSLPMATPSAKNHAPPPTSGHAADQGETAMIVDLRAFADSISLPLSIFDHGGRFAYVNRVACEWFGRTEAEILGQT